MGLEKPEIRVRLWPQVIVYASVGNPEFERTNQGPGGQRQKTAGGCE